jgi:hypothetical protein
LSYRHLSSWRWLMGGWNVGDLFHWTPSPTPCPIPGVQGCHCCIWLWKFSMWEPLFPTTCPRSTSRSGFQATPCLLTGRLAAGDDPEEGLFKEDKRLPSRDPSAPPIGRQARRVLHFHPSVRGAISVPLPAAHPKRLGSTPLGQPNLQASAQAPRCIAFLHCA